MNNEKAEKAEQELAWQDARGFARSFEDWANGDVDEISYSEARKKCGFFSVLTENEKEWLLKAYGKAKKKENRVFFKTLIYFMYLLGTKKIGCDNLAKILRKMARDEARLGEFYDYLVQYSDERVDYKEIRFGSLASAIREGSKIEKEYYNWFRKEFNVPPEGAWSEYPNFFTTRTPKEFIEMRKKVDWKPLSSILSTTYGIYVGNAVLGKIEDYVKHGRITKLSFESKERAARIASLLFEFNLEDLSQSSNKVTLGLKETIYRARKKVGGSPSIPAEAYLIEDYLDYFKDHGLNRVHIAEIGGLFESGADIEALDKMCKSMLQACKKQYLIMGGKKYTFGKEGIRMVSDFKKYVGAEGDASLLLLYEMINRGDYTAALKRLKTICGALEEVRMEYPHLF